MNSAPRSCAASRKCLNLISRLHSTSGFGVRPAAYSARKCANTPSQYSREKSRKWIGIPSRPLTATASRRSSSARQSPLPSSAQFCMNKPAIGSPASRRCNAATEESTPPDMPTMVLVCTALMSACSCQLAHGCSCQVLGQLQRVPVPRQEVRGCPPHQRAAVALLGRLQLAGRHPDRADDAVVQRARRIVPDRFGGKGETQVMASAASVAVVRCLPLVGTDERGEADIPAGLLERFPQRGLVQALV